MIARRHSFTIWPLLLLLALAVACGHESPRAQARPAATDIQWMSWRVADTGIGPISIGMTPSQANSAVGGSLELPQGMTSEACDYASPRGMDSLAFMIEQGRVVRVDVTKPGIRTVAGAEVGDSETTIQRLYAGRVRVSPHKYTKGHYLTVLPVDTAGHPYRLVFETNGAVVTTYRTGVLPQVEYVERCS